MTQAARKWRIILALAVSAALFALSGCGTASGPSSSLDLNPYTVDFTADPAVPQAGAPVMLSIAINGKEPVPKNSEIYYEVKKTGTTDREKVDAKSAGGSHYQGVHTFKEAGFYDITIHVTTRSVHQIVSRQLEIK